jgi:hypothetical protein
MKTTIDIDTEKVRRLMKTTGLKTCKAVVDYALTEADRTARMDKLVREALPPSAFRDAVDPAYDVYALRHKERP